MPSLVPSMALLRAFLSPNTVPSVSSHCLRIAASQSRSASNWMPRKKFAKITSLDKLHRRQRDSRIQERLDSQTRAESLAFAPSPPSSATTTPDVATTASSSSLASTDLLPYLVQRTPSLKLPVYEHSKSGGTRHETVIRKISGDVTTLQRHIREALNLGDTYVDGKGRKKEFVRVNPVTNHVVVRGWRAAEVKRWLELGGF